MPSNNCRIEVRVLGTISVNVAGEALKLSPVERHLVALLAAATRTGLDADRLADQLWPERLPDTWKASLRNNFSRLNKKVEQAHPQNRRLISDRVANRSLQVEPEDVDLWRLHAWAADPDSIEAADIDADPSLLGGAPFPNCEISPLLQEAAATALASRQDIIASWSRQGERLSHRLLAELRRLSLEDPYNGPLAESVAELHVAVDEHRQAHQFITDLVDEAPLSDALVELYESLNLDRRPGAFDSSAGRATFPTHASSITRLTQNPIAGRAELLGDLLAAADEGKPGVLIHGEPGVGKTRLAAELAAQLGASGYHTAYVVADENLFGSLQPFLDAFPDLAATVKPYLAKLHDPNAQAVCRQEIIRHLETAFEGHPLCLVADDLQWLDDQSGGLLLSLCRAELDIPLFVVGVGRAKDQSGRWSSWLSELTRTGLTQFKVRPLGPGEILELVDDQFNALEQLNARTLADQVLELSSGIPDVAHWLLERTGEDTLHIRMDDVEGTGYGAMVKQLPAAVQTCGAIGSLLGQQFDIDGLIRLGRYDQVDARENLQSLLDSGLLTELIAPGTYRFVHILAAEAFAQTLPRSERAELHARAFELFHDTASRARHAKMAAPIIGSQAAADSLLLAGRKFFGEGSYRAAVDAVDSAIRLDQESVKLGDRVMHLEALERSGVRASEQRAALISEALALSDYGAALSAAASGLPEMEAIEGDITRVRSLEQVDAYQLGSDQRIHLHTQLCRQYLLLGRVDDARAQADLATECADNPDRRAQAWLARRIVDGVGRPMGQHENWPVVEEIQSEELRLRIRQAEAVDIIATGQGQTRFAFLLQFADMVPEDRLPQLYWFAQMFLVTAATDQGEYDEATLRARRANRFGAEAGLRIAAGTYQTQLFAWEFHKRSHGSLYPVVAETAANDIAANIIFAAGLAACRFAHATNERELAEAFDEVRRICNRAMRSHFDIAAIGIMADAIAAIGDTRLMGWANERLSTRKGGYVLVASAAANLGPCTGLMAKLQADRRSTIELQEEAVSEADTSHLALWQIVSRLDLAESLDPTDGKAARIRDEARAMASTKWLEQVVAGRESNPASS